MIVIYGGARVASQKPLQNDCTGRFKTLLFCGFPQKSFCGKAADAIERTGALFLSFVSDLFPSLDLVCLAARLGVMAQEPDVLLQARYRFPFGHDHSVYQTVIEKQVISKFNKTQYLLQLHKS